MAGRDAYSAIEAIDKITAMKNEGYTEAEIALKFGFTNKGKSNIPMFRKYVSDQRMEARIIKARQVKELMDDGYSINEAAEKLGIPFSTARALSLFHDMNKGD